MKSLQEFKTVLTEEEKPDYSKFDTLVRAGLADKTQIQRLHKILGKMGEERPVFSPQERQLLQNLFNKMVDLVTGNKQLFQQTRRVVREEDELEEGLLATSDYKIGPSGRKVKSHRIKVGDTVSTIGGDAEEQSARYESVQEAAPIKPVLRGDPPFTLVLKRKAIRQYTGDMKVALYYSDRLKAYFSVPYSDMGDDKAVIQAQESVETLIDQLKEGTVYHKNGKTSQIDEQTYELLLKVYNSLNEDNKQKFETLIVSNPNGLQKAIEFSTK